MAWALGVAVLAALQAAQPVTVACESREGQRFASPGVLYLTLDPEGLRWCYVNGDQCEGPPQPIVRIEPTRYVLAEGDRNYYLDRDSGFLWMENISFTTARYCEPTSPLVPIPRPLF